MDYAQSFFMEIMWIHLVFLSLVGALGPYTGSSSRQLIHNEYENVQIPPASDTKKCLEVMQYFCSSYVSLPSKDDCAKSGVFYWSKTLNVPDYIEDYFELFRNYLIPGPFHLPNDFCEKHATTYPAVPNETMEDFIFRFNCISDDCKEHLSVFRNLEVHSTFGQNFYEFELQSRMNILLYAFYDMKIDPYMMQTSFLEPSSFSGNVVAYVRRIAELTQVAHAMPTPLSYCIDRFPPKDSSEESDNSMETS